MKYLKLAVVLVLFSCGTEREKGSEKSIKSPLINGKFDSEEWSNSEKIDIQSKFELHLKQNEYYYYIGVRNKTDLPFYVDIFFKIDDSLYNIHSSSQLGERELNVDDWSDETPIFNWGYLNDWNANTVLFDRRKFNTLRENGFDGNMALETLIPYDGFEFQFSKQTWNLNGSKMRIEMRNMVGIENYEETIFLNNSDRKEPEGWFLLNFK